MNHHKFLKLTERLQPISNQPNDNIMIHYGKQPVEIKQSLDVKHLFSQFIDPKILNFQSQIQPRRWIITNLTEGPLLSFLFSL